MSRKWVVLILLTASLAVAGANKDKQNPDESREKPTVTIKSLQYTPVQVSIQAGQTVVWINKDDHDHTVTADDGSFNSGNIRSGQRFEHSFKKAGTFSYSCKYHPRMKGTVTVK